MNITKPINRKGKAALTLGAGLVLSCCAVYAANKEVKKKTTLTTQDSILELRDDDGITYIKENDNFYIEEDGQRREMNEAERAAFERKHEKVMAELEVTEQELVLMEKEIEESLKELELQADEVERVNTEEVELAAIEMEQAHEELKRAQHEIELEFESGDLSEEEMLRVKESLQLAKEEMVRDRERIKVDMERVKRDLEKAHIEIRKQRAQGMRVPPQPSHEAHRIIKIDERVFTDSSDGKHRVVKWTEDNGKVYTVANGDYFVEEAGKKRPMTAKEKARFEEKVKFIPQPPRMPKAPKPPRRVKGDALSVLEQPQANYPEEAMANNIEGYVDLTFDINGQGKATNVRVQGSSANGIFNKEAIDTIKKWRFSEKEYGKKAMSYKMKFALDN